MSSEILDARPGVNTGRSSLSVARGRSLSFRVALSLSVLVATSLGGAGGLIVYRSVAVVIERIEAVGAEQAEWAADSLASLEGMSAANVARALDVVTADLLSVQAASVALLVDAAESAAKSEDYLVDALRQATFRSPLRSVDVVAVDGTGRSYSTGGAPPLWNALDSAVRNLADAEPFSVVALPSVGDGDGLLVMAAARLSGRAAVARVFYRVDAAGAAAVYGEEGDRSAEAAAEAHVAASARFLAHAVELAAEAGWRGPRLRLAFSAVETRTAASTASIFDDAGDAVVGTGRAGEPGKAGEDAFSAAFDRLYDADQGVVLLDPWAHPVSGLRHVSALASRGRGSNGVVVSIVSRARSASLVETAWQVEVDRLAALEGVSGVWLAGPGPDGPQVFAAGPRPAATVPGAVAEVDAWDRWSDLQVDSARAAVSAGRGVSGASLSYLTPASSRVLSAAPLPGASRIGTVVVLEHLAADDVRSLSALVVTVVALVFGFGLVAVLVGGAASRRFVGAPVEALALAATTIGAGVRPELSVTEPFIRRRDELGLLVRYFRSMADDVVKRQDELDSLVRERTASLRAAHDEIAADKSRLEADLRLGEQVQKALLPTAEGTAGPFRYACRVTPARQLSGDFVTVVPSPDGSRVFLALCDVSGKGVGAALFMALAQSVLSVTATSGVGLDLIAREANRRLSAHNPMGMFVTALLFLLDPGERLLHHVCVGHEPPLLMGRPGGLVRLHPDDDSSCLPLGVSPDIEYPVTTTVLVPGETVVAYTDGITDGVDTEGTLFGEDRLQGLLTELSPGLGPVDVLDEVWRGTDAFAEGASVVDDRTMLVLSSPFVK